jgi:hypothetical protein
VAIFRYSNSGVWGHDLFCMGVRTAHEAPEKSQMNECKTNPSTPTNASISLEDVN